MKEYYIKSKSGEINIVDWNTLIEEAVSRGYEGIGSVKSTSGSAKYLRGMGLEVGYAKDLK